MLIRRERADDVAHIHELNRAVFGSPAEALLVDALREQDPTSVSLVADVDGAVVGHILFSRVAIEGAKELRVMALAPMAVPQERQRQGVGTALVNEGLAECRRLGVCAVFVLGHRTYYPRFGFTPALQFDIRCEFDVPQDAFFAIELVTDALKNTKGVVRYPAAFRLVTNDD
jgi:putative acetyltransferase